MMLREKRAFIVGGTSGIGLAVAQAFAESGADVVVGGRRPAPAGLRSVAIDVSDEESVVAALSEVGEIDVLVLNAGIAQPPGPISSLDSDAARAVVDTNLLGTFWGLKHGPAQMRDGGSIVVTSSIAADLATPFEALYGATKAGVTSLARSAAIDLGPRGIRVNSVQPGPTWTDMNPMPERMLEIMAPAGRKATVDDMVGVFVFLASDASSYVSGQAITVDGGLTAGVSQGLLGVLAAQTMEEAAA
jgi:NAD(P)-dependent dehydrogenase (short-subunit alcohol dehydrogenase family)